MTLDSYHTLNVGVFYIANTTGSVVQQPAAFFLALPYSLQLNPEFIVKMAYGPIDISGYSYYFSSIKVLLPESARLPTAAAAAAPASQNQRRGRPCARGQYARGQQRVVLGSALPSRGTKMPKWRIAPTQSAGLLDLQVRCQSSRHCTGGGLGSTKRQRAKHAAHNRQTATARRCG